MRRDQRKGIFCLEGDWWGVKDFTTVEPVLRLLETAERAALAESVNLFGEENVNAQIKQNIALPSRKILMKILDNLYGFLGTAGLADDLTMLSIERVPVKDKQKRTSKTIAHKKKKQKPTRKKPKKEKPTKKK